MSDNYQQWLDGEIGDSELNRRQANEYTGGIPVELPVDRVRSYVQNEQLTFERFDLLQAYFEGRIIKLLEGFDPRTAIGDLLLLLIKGENK
jgi:hypothetical protein